MTATSTSADNTTITVSEQIEALSHKWDHYFCPPYGTQLWPGLAKINRISEGLLRVGKTIFINVLPAAIPLQVLIYFDALNWTNLVIDALLVLEIGPCRLLTRLVNKVAPYPEEITLREDREDIPYTDVTRARGRDGAYAKSFPILLPPPHQSP